MNVKETERRTAMQLRLIIALCFVGSTLASTTPAPTLKAFLDCDKDKPLPTRTLTKVCYQDERLPKGCECFSVGKTSGYGQDRASVPMGPDDVDVTYELYTQSNKDTNESIQANDSFVGSNFKAGKPVKFLIHGNTHKFEVDWYAKMKDAILKKDDANVIFVLWKKQHFYTPMSTLVANSRIVGAMVANFILHLNKLDMTTGYADVHLIGHGIGAHASGMAGKEVHRLTGQKVGRISGLDPFGIGFPKGDRSVLTPGDASYVDVIYTDKRVNHNTNGFGISYNVGHINYWPSKGTAQPGCKQTDAKSPFLHCDHAIAVDYYISSVSSCQYLLYKSCRMGYYASQAACGNGTYPDIRMESKSPYCVIVNKG